MRPNILLIAPYGPPKNAAEALQVRRILAQLDAVSEGMYVTLPSFEAGWAKPEASLALQLANYQTHVLSFPISNKLVRVFGSRRLRRLHRPDSDAWITYCTSQIIRSLKQIPDVIYSRAYPFSAAVLGRKLAERLQRPWIMHLSDPWTGIEGDKATPEALASERACFHAADLISLTTPGQQAFFQARYPEVAERIFVSPNMYPAADELAHIPAPVSRPAEAPLQVVYAGALYSTRNPEVLVQAVKHLRDTKPELAALLRIDCYGNTVEPFRKLIESAAPTMQHHGHLSLGRAQAMQANADMILSIDLLDQNPIHRHLLLSKTLDAMALQKPLLSLAYANSVSAQTCNAGYGWVLPPEDPQAIAAQLAQLVQQRDAIRNSMFPPLPEAYHASQVAQVLMDKIGGLMNGRAS